VLSPAEEEDMLVVVSLGGNAIARPDEPFDLEEQRANVHAAARSLADLARRHDLVVTYGNGPQVGLLVGQAGEAGDAMTPLDVLGAESEGMIGYWLDQELSSLLPDRDVAALVTQVEVSADDPAFKEPSQPIGPLWSRADASRLAAERGWSFAPEHGAHRRLVPSLEPRALHGLRTVQLLVRFGGLVISGGGIPVVRSPEGVLRGVEAVVDKDLSAAMLATRIGASYLLMLTDVPAVYADWPDPAVEEIRAISPRMLRNFDFDPGTMAPKIEAAHRFATQPGRTAAIGALEDASRILRGQVGTTITAHAEKLEIVRVD
jgi:carbamate kinase